MRSGAVPGRTGRARTIGSLAEMDAIADDWRALETLSADRLTYFQGFDWCRGWVKAYAAEEGGAQPRIETFWVGSDLVAVWPLMTISAGGVRILQNLGEPHSQYCNLLYDAARFSPSDAASLFSRIVDEPACDVAVFRAVPDCSPLSRLLPRAARCDRDENMSSVLNLSGFASSDDYLAQLGTTRARNRRRRRKALSKIGELGFEMIWPGDPRFPELVRVCVAMKRRWLGETGRLSAGFRIAGYDEFLAGLTGDPETLSGACLSVLKAGERIAAMELGFLKDRHYYAYIGGFDWDLRDLSPGKVQMDITVCWLIDNGITGYDLLGNPSDYKQSWSNTEIRLNAYTLPFSWKGRVYAGAWLPVLLPAAKKLYAAAPEAIRRVVASVQSFGLLILYV